LCDCAAIREGWDCVAEWRREGDHDGKGTRVVDKVNVSLAKAVSGGNCDVGRRLARGCGRIHRTISSDEIERLSKAQIKVIDC